MVIRELGALPALLAPGNLDIILRAPCFGQFVFVLVSPEKYRSLDFSARDFPRNFRIQCFGGFDSGYTCICQSTEAFGLISEIF